MWSPPYVDQPSASSVRSPVPRSIACSSDAIEKSRNLRAQAWTFSKVTSSFIGSCPIAAKTWPAMSVMSVSRSVAPTARTAAQAPEEGHVPRFVDRPEVDGAERPAVGRRVLAPRPLPQPILRERIEVHVDHRDVPAEREALRLRDQLAALGDEPVSVPGEVRR